MARAMLHQKAIHMGTFGSLMFAVTALLSNFMLSILQASVISENKGAHNTRSNWRRFMDMRWIWASAHILFAIFMISTIFVTSSTAGTLIVAGPGISWAVTLWAPFAIIGTELSESRRDLEKESRDGSYDTNTAAIMGLHNVAISAPQIIAATLSSFIFWVAHETGTEAGMRWVFGFCGGAALVAGYLTSRLDDEW